MYNTNFNPNYIKNINYYSESKYSLYNCLIRHQVKMLNKEGNNSI